MDKYIVGLTGGIGSGKTTVSDAFNRLGIDIVDADEISHQVTAPEQPAVKQIAAHFGEQALTDKQHLNRAWLRQHIFANPSAKLWLESLLHPIIKTATLNAIASSNSAYTLLVSPLLLESSMHKLCQRILVIDTTLELQIQRTIDRDQSSRETIEAIIAQQISREKRLALADDIIDNSNDKALLLSQTHNLHQRYLQLAQASR